MTTPHPGQAMLSRDTDMTKTDATRAVIAAVLDGEQGPGAPDIDDLFAEGLRWMGDRGGGARRGLGDRADTWRDPFDAAFSDRTRIDQARVFMGEWAGAFGRLEATHSGAFMGIGPTGKRLEIRYMDFWKVVDGRIVETRALVDYPGLLAQLGVDMVNAEGAETLDQDAPQPDPDPSPHPVRPLGWAASAPGWIAVQGETGDPTRRFVLDAPMLSALPEAGTVLDIGCGEGRFCRMMRARGLDAVGLDPTEALLARARMLDPGGTYLAGVAENPPLADASFDAVVFYLSLIDIPDFRAAIRQAARLLRPGGRLLIGNLHAFMTARPRDWAGEGSHWVSEDGALKHVAMDDMQTERAYVTSWRDIRILNHHRPLSAYMRALLGEGLTLTRFEDPPWTGPEGAAKDKFDRAPWAFFMCWEKPQRG